MSRNSLLEAGAKSEGEVTATGSEGEVTATGSNPVAVTSPSDFAPASSKEFLDIQATIECGFTLKRVRDMIKTYSQMLLIMEICLHVFRQLNFGLLSV